MIDPKEIMTCLEKAEVEIAEGIALLKGREEVPAEKIKSTNKGDPSMDAPEGSGRKVVPAGGDREQAKRRSYMPPDVAAAGDEDEIQVITNVNMLTMLSDRRVGNLLFGSDYKYNAKMTAPLGQLMSIFNLLGYLSIWQVIPLYMLIPSVIVCHAYNLHECLSLNVQILGMLLRRLPIIMMMIWGVVSLVVSIQLSIEWDYQLAVILFYIHIFILNTYNSFFDGKCVVVTFPIDYSIYTCTRLLCVLIRRRKGERDTNFCIQYVSQRGSQSRVAIRM